MNVAFLMPRVRQMQLAPAFPELALTLVVGRILRFAADVGHA